MSRHPRRAERGCHQDRDQSMPTTSPRMTRHHRGQTPSHRAASAEPAFSLHITYPQTQWNQCIQYILFQVSFFIVFCVFIVFILLFSFCGFCVLLHYTLNNQYGTSSRPCPELERSCLHEVLSMFIDPERISMLSWGQGCEAGNLHPGRVARYDDWRGRPGGRIQSLGSPRIDTLSAVVMSSDVSILATCPMHQTIGLIGYIGPQTLVR